MSVCSCMGHGKGSGAVIGRAFIVFMLNSIITFSTMRGETKMRPRLTWHSVFGYGWGVIHGCWLTAAIRSLSPGFEDQVSGVRCQESGT